LGGPAARPPRRARPAPDAARRAPAVDPSHATLPRHYCLDAVSGVERLPRNSTRSRPLKTLGLITHVPRQLVPTTFSAVLAPATGYVTPLAIAPRMQKLILKGE